MIVVTLQCSCGKFFTWSLGLELLRAVQRSVNWRNYFVFFFYFELINDTMFLTFLWVHLFLKNLKATLNLHQNTPKQVFTWPFLFSLMFPKGCKFSCKFSHYQQGKKKKDKDELHWMDEQFLKEKRKAPRKETVTTSGPSWKQHESSSSGFCLFQTLQNCLQEIAYGKFYPGEACVLV